MVLWSYGPIAYGPIALRQYGPMVPFLALTADHTLLTLFLTVIALPYLACTCLALPGLSWMPQKQVFWLKTGIL